jgi:alkylhydroperoxidase family enzyme
MARISLDPPPTFSYRIGRWFLRRRFGEVLDPFRAQAHNMPVAQAFGRLEQSAAKGNKLGLQIRDLADMSAAVKIGCSWCMDFGYWIMHTHGFPREKIEAISHWRDSKLFDPLERLVMEYAEAMTETPPTVDDELVSRLRDHLDEARLVELTAIICLENVRSRFNSAVGLTRQGFKSRCEVQQPKGRSEHVRAALAGDGGPGSSRGVR